MVRRIDVEHVALDGLQEPKHAREAAEGPAALGVVAVFRQPRVLQEECDVVVAAHEPGRLPEDLGG
jgi:hypothetical protein